MKPGTKNIKFELICTLFILLWTYSGLTKYIEHEKFITSLKASSITAPAAKMISWFIPSTELIAAFCLLMPVFRRVGIWLSSITMICFTLYIGYMLLFVPNLPCSCGGLIEQMSWETHLWFNIGLLGLAVWGIRLLKINKNFIAINTDSLAKTDRQE